VGIDEPSLNLDASPSVHAVAMNEIATSNRATAGSY